VADVSSAPTWIQLLVSSGVLGIVGAGVAKVWGWTVERPLQRAESRLEKLEQENDYLIRKNGELSAELKAAAITARSLRRLKEEDDGAPLSMPPPRDEMPTINAIVDLRQDAVYAHEQERSRQAPLNTPEPKRLPLEGLGGRSDSLDHTLHRYNNDIASTPPEPYRKRMKSEKG
jgi:hypothetical protein